MTSPAINQIERQIAPIAHTPMYNWHKYWARKTWNVIGEFVKNYCPPGGTVLDPFAGSGVTGIEAVRHGRRAVLVDLTPVMEEVVWATLVDVEPSAIASAYARIDAIVGDEIRSLYRTTCPTCGTEQHSWARRAREGRARPSRASREPRWRFADRRAARSAWRPHPRVQLRAAPV